MRRSGVRSPSAPPCKSFVASKFRDDLLASLFLEAMPRSAGRLKSFPLKTETEAGGVPRVTTAGNVEKCMRMTHRTIDSAAWGVAVWLVALGYGFGAALAWGEDTAPKAPVSDTAVVPEDKRAEPEAEKTVAEAVKPDAEKAGGIGRWIKFREGKWRLEVTADGGAHTQANHAGDHLITTKVEYEMPVMAHGALGLRLVPIFASPRTTMIRSGARSCGTSGCARA